MFSILKKKKPFEQEAKELYAQCLETVRQPFFYTKYDIEDTMDARFDLLLLHVYIIIEYNLLRCPDIASELNQAVFDVLFADMDQTLREIGIGDTGLPKRMKKMMLGFNGRMHSYRLAFANIDENDSNDELLQAIAKNIYQRQDIHQNTINFTNYAREQRSHVMAIHSGSLNDAETIFKNTAIADYNKEL